MLLLEFDVDVFSNLIGMLEDAIRRCKDAGGDSRLKLEMFLVHVVRSVTCFKPLMNGDTTYMPIAATSIR
jgi:hypothetical protein